MLKEKTFHRGSGVKALPANQVAHPVVKHEPRKPYCRPSMTPERVAEWRLTLINQGIIIPVSVS